MVGYKIKAFVSVSLFKSYLYPLHFLGLFITSGLFTLMQLWHIFHRICQFAIFYYLEDDGVFLIKNLLDTIFPSHQSLFIWELISMLSIEYFLTIVKLYIQTPPQLLVCCARLRHHRLTQALALMFRTSVSTRNDQWSTQQQQSH